MIKRVCPQSGLIDGDDVDSGQGNTEHDIQ